MPEGAELGRDVTSGRADRIPLLRAGTPITDRYREALEREGLHAVYINDPATDGIEPQAPLSPETRAAATQAVSRTLEAAQAAIEAGRPLPADAVQSLDAIAIRMVNEIARTTPLAFALADLSTADAYTLEHSVDVAAVGLLIARQMFKERGYADFRGRQTWERIDVRLTHLGLGLLLHDIGKLAVPAAVLEKPPEELAPHEEEILRSHTWSGVQLLSSDLISPLVKVIVRWHHERWDGDGYPDRRAGKDIHELARIAAVANTFDELTSERVHTPAQPAHVGVRAVREGRGTAFDPEVVDVFSKLIAPFPPGDSVELADGRAGVVASVPEDAVDRPVVRIIGDGDPYDLALTEYPSLRIVGWEDMDGAAGTEPRRHWAV